MGHPLKSSLHIEIFADKTGPGSEHTFAFDFPIDDIDNQSQHPQWDYKIRAN